MDFLLIFYVIPLFIPLFLFISKGFQPPKINSMKDYALFGGENSDEKEEKK